MSTRKEAEAAIHLWRRLGLLQKVLAFRAGVSASAVSKIVHEPGYTRCEDVYRRIRDVVQREFTTRIDSLPLTVLTMCEDRPRTFDTGTTAAVVAGVKDKLQHLAAPGAVAMPQGIGGAILRVGIDEGMSGLFLIAVPEGSDNRKITAFIHELDHFKDYLTRGFRRDFRPPPVGVLRLLMDTIEHPDVLEPTDRHERVDQTWSNRRAKFYTAEKEWIAAYCVAHDFLVREGSDPSDPRDTVASILVNQGSTPNVVVEKALEWIGIHWASGPFDVTWYTPGGLVNATLHDFRKANSPCSLGAQAFLFPGRVNTDLQAVSGPEAELFVEKLDIDFTYAFLSAYAFDLEAGRTRFQYSEEARLQRACAWLYADHKFLFLDASKFKREGKHGYGLEHLLEQAKTVTIYTTSSPQDQSIANRFLSLCETLLPQGPVDPWRSRTMRLRIVVPGATGAQAFEHTGYLTPPQQKDPQSA